MTQILRHIVAATDLSDRGEAAMARAADLAAAHSSSLTVVHVIDEVLPEPVALALRREAGDLLEKKIADLAKSRKLPASKVKVEIQRGRPEQAVAELCAHTSADLLVAGPRRPDPIWRTLRGGTVHRMLTMVESPALIARPGGSPAPARVLAAIDFSVASEKALKFACQIYPRAAFTLMHAVDLAESAFVPSAAAGRYRRQVEAAAAAELGAFARRAGLAAVESQTIRIGKPSDAILDEARSIGAELVALGTHGRTGIGQALLGSVATEVAAGASADVLIARAW